MKNISVTFNIPGKNYKWSRGWLGILLRIYYENKKQYLCINENNDSNCYKNHLIKLISETKKCELQSDVSLFDYFYYIRKLKILHLNLYWIIFKWRSSV